MKKFTLFAAMAALAVSASAQYTTETPYADQSVVAGETQIFDLMITAEDITTDLIKAGQQVNDWHIDETNIFFYIWDGTFTGGDSSYPGVGYNNFHYDGYTDLVVTSVGWSGAGLFVSENAGKSSMHWNENTKFHVATRTGSLAPSSVAFIIADGGGVIGVDDKGNNIHSGSPAKVALGDSFNDGGAIYPTIGPKINDEWTGIDISFADLKKMYPTFQWANVENWEGNAVSVLGGGVTGQSFSIDCMYFHTPVSGEDNAVGSVTGDAQFVVTGNTVNTTLNGIELYDLSGRLIKSTEGTTLGISDLGSGLFVVKSGNSVKKIMK